MTIHFASLLSRNITDSIEAKRAFIANSEQVACFNYAVDHVINCYRNNGRLYLAGNGGSAADAQHLAAEFVSKLARERNPLPAEAITTDSSIVTAIGNDYGYEYVFSRQLAAKLTDNDTFLGISTSGESQNIINALEQCRSIGVKSIVFTGQQGGRAAKLADFSVIVPGARTSTIQELHILLGHTLCEAVESVLFPIQQVERQNYGI